jgi:hypothetical protein
MRVRGVMGISEPQLCEAPETFCGLLETRCQLPKTLAQPVLETQLHILVLLGAIISLAISLDGSPHRFDSR